jgi:hypothetical protein
MVTVVELVAGMEILLGTPRADCSASAFDRNGDGQVTVDEIVAATQTARIGCAGEAVAVKMDAAIAGGFFSLPWPNDVRVAAGGTLNLTGFPGSQNNPIIQLILARGAKVTTGFGTNAAVFFQTTGAIDAASLPGAEASLTDSATAMLVNLDEPEAPRVPLLVDFKADAGNVRPANLLALLPYPGHPLQPRTRYAAILFTGIHDAQGMPLQPAPLLGEMSAAARGSSVTNSDNLDALLAQRDAVFAYVAAHTTWLPSQVAAFTVYTTQDPVGDMSAIRAAVDALPSPTPVSRGEGSCPAGAGG